MATATTVPTSAVTTTPAVPTWAALVELFANIGLTGLTAGGVLPPGTSALAVGIENALLPLLQSIGSGQTKTQTTLAAFGAMVGILQTTAKQTGLSAQTISNIETLEAAVADAVAAFMAGETDVPDLATLAQPVPTV